MCVVVFVVVVVCLLFLGGDENITLKKRIKKYESC